MSAPQDRGNYQPLTYFQLMEVSLRELLVEKGVVSEQAVSDAMEEMRRRGPDTGARVVARAWADPEFKRLLLDNVAHIGGGFDEWKKKGAPVAEKSKRS